MKIQVRDAVQCIAHNGKKGTFLWDTRNEDGTFNAVSPIFDDLVGLFNWIHENSIPIVGYENGNRYMPIYEMEAQQ